MTNATIEDPQVETLDVDALLEDLSAESFMQMDDDERAAVLATADVPEHSGEYVRTQPAGDRTFNVRGPKAEAIRAAIYLGIDLTRKELAALANASVSRVGEVVWGLEHDNLDFPAIPKARKAVEVEEQEDDAAESDAAA